MKLEIVASNSKIDFYTQIIVNIRYFTFLLTFSRNQN